MCPTAHHTDVPRQSVVSLVSVCVQPSREALQEMLSVLRFSRGLVLIQHNSLFCAATGAVQPHVGLSGGGTSRLFQHLQGRLIRVQHRLPAKLLMQCIKTYHYQPEGQTNVPKHTGAVQKLPLQSKMRCE